MLSVGDWRYTKDFTAELFDDNQQSIGTGTLYLKDAKVGDAAQFVSYLEADYKLGSKFSVDLGYRFPNKFRIDMSYDDKRVATRILDCYLESFNTNYNPNSMSFHEDGNFPEVNIALSFREERTLRKKDIKDGF